MYMKWDIYIFPNFNLPSSLLLFFHLYIAACVPKSKNVPNRISRIFGLNIFSYIRRRIYLFIYRFLMASSTKILVFVLVGALIFISGTTDARMINEVASKQGGGAFEEAKTYAFFHHKFPGYGYGLGKGVGFGGDFGSGVGYGGNVGGFGSQSGSGSGSESGTGAGSGSGSDAGAGAGAGSAVEGQGAGGVSP